MKRSCGAQAGRGGRWLFVAWMAVAVVNVARSGEDADGWKPRFADAMGESSQAGADEAVQALVDESNAEFAMAEGRYHLQLARECLRKVQPYDFEVLARLLSPHLTPDSTTRQRSMFYTALAMAAMRLSPEKRRDSLRTLMELAAWDGKHPIDRFGPNNPSGILLGVVRNGCRPGEYPPEIKRGIVALLVEDPRNEDLLRLAGLADIPEALPEIRKVFASGLPAEAFDAESARSPRYREAVAAGKIRLWPKGGVQGTPAYAAMEAMARNGDREAMDILLEQAAFLESLCADAAESERVHASVQDEILASLVYTQRPECLAAAVRIMIALQRKPYHPDTHMLLNELYPESPPFDRTWGEGAAALVAWAIKELPGK